MIMQTKLIFLLVFMPIVAFAQPQSGVKIGANTASVQDPEYFKYQSRLGFDIGYQQVFTLKPKMVLTTGLMLNRYSLSVSDVDGTIMSMSTMNMNSSFLSIPLAFNYVINKWYLFGGYQYGYNLEGSLPVNTHNHSLIAGVGYSTKIVDLSLQYMHTLNQETLDRGIYSLSQDGLVVKNYPEKGIRIQTIQLSATIPLGKRKK